MCKECSLRFIAIIVYACQAYELITGIAKLQKS